MADEEADYPPLVTSSGQEWQFHISTVRAQEWQLFELILAD